MEPKNKVLVVDDDPTLLKQTQLILQHIYEVHLAASGKQALALLSKGSRPDLILLDILMPDMDGYQTLTAIRGIEDCDRIPVIFLTSVSEAEAEVRGLETGAVDYIIKPFSEQVLMARAAIRIKNAKRISAGYELDESKLENLPKPISEAERKVLRLLVCAYTNREISVELCYSYDYVRKLVSQVLGKLGLESRNEVKKYRR